MWRARSGGFVGVLNVLLLSFLLLLLLLPCSLAWLPVSPSLSVSTSRGFVGNSIGPGHSDPVFSQVLSAPNNYAAAALDPSTGDVYTNAVWEESAKEMNRIGADGRWLGRVEESHGWSRTGGSAVAVGKQRAFFSGVQGYIGEAYQPPDYPPEGVQWWGVFVADKESMLPVSLPNGTSFERMFLVTSTTGTASAMALDAGTQLLTIMHPTDAAMQVWDAATMRRVSVVSGAANWTSLTFVASSSHSTSASAASQLWGVLDGQVYPVDPSTGRVQDGAPPLKGIERAVSVMGSMSAADTLVVADGGLHTQRVFIFHVADPRSPTLVDAIGELGGVWGQPPPGALPRGMRGDLRFEWLTSAGQGPDGSVVVVCASNTVWQGSEMMATVKSFRKSSAHWTMQWEMEGNSWVDAGAVDPASQGRLLFLPNCVYELTLPLLPDRASGRCVASSTDLVRYPQDPRLHSDNFSFQSARVVYLAGRRFLMLTSMYGGVIALYRYANNASFTAIPSALLLLTGPYTDAHKGELWPPNQPKSSYTWVDRNCDGRFDGDEYQLHAHALPSAWSTSIDSSGALWLLQERSVQRVPFLGLDACGNPLFDRDSNLTQSWTMPAEFSYIERLHYSPATDTLMLTGWDPHSAQGHGARWGTAGNLLVFYAGWLAGNRTVKASTTLRSEWNATQFPQGPVIKTLAWVDDLLFLVEGYSATVTVMDAATLHNLTAVLFNPSPASDWHNGWIDVPDGLQATRVNDSDYLVVMEDDYCAKTSLLSVRVLPNTSTLCARMAFDLMGNATAAGELALLTLLVTTMWLGTPDSRHGSNVFGWANPLSPLIPILHGDVAYRQDGSQAPDYLADAAAQAVLASKFVAFMGSALGCAANGFPAYAANHSVQWVHARMGIGRAQFEYFNAQVTLTLQYWGLPEDGTDMAGVKGWLEAFGKGAGDDEICSAADCEEPTNGYEERTAID